MGSWAGWVDALKALCDGGLRQMSVPGGAERLKGSIFVMVDMVASMISKKELRNLV